MNISAYHQEVISAMEFILHGLNDNAIFKNDVLVGDQIDGVIDNPIAAGIIHDEIGNAGTNSSLQALRGILFIKSPPTGVGRFQCARFHLGDFGSVRLR